MAIKAVVPMIDIVVQTEMGIFAVKRVKDVVRTVAVRVMLSSATVTVIASCRLVLVVLRYHLRPPALLLLLLLLVRRLTLQVHVLKQEELANTRIHLNAVVGDLFSALQVESISIHLVVQAPVAFNLRTINQCTVGKICCEVRGCGTL